MPILKEKGISSILMKELEREEEFIYRKESIEISSILMEVLWERRLSTNTPPQRKDE